MKTNRLIPTVLIASLILGITGCNNQSVTEIQNDGFENQETSIETTQNELISESTIENNTTVTPTPIISTGEKTVAATNTPKPSDDSSSKNMTEANTSGESSSSGNSNTPTPQPANNIDNSPGGSSNNSSGSGNVISVTDTPVPTATPSPVPTATPTPTPTSTPVPTATPTPEPTEAPKPAVAAYVQATFIVYGSTDDENPTYVESTVVRTYTVQPKDGCSYHSHQVSDYVCIDNQIDWTDLDNAFLKEHPGCVVHGYDTVGEQVIGFVDD